MAKNKKMTVTIEKPCWRKVVKIGSDEFDDKVMDKLYGEDDDLDLAPSTKNIEALARELEEEHLEDAKRAKPRMEKLALMRTSWGADNWRLIMTYDVDKREFELWRRDCVEVEEQVVEVVPVEEVVEDIE